MSLNFLPLTAESVLRSRTTDAGDLGVAVWQVLNVANPPDGEAETVHEVKVFELDLASGDGRGGNDEVATLRFTVRSQSDVAVTSSRNRAPDPSATIELHFRLARDPRDEAVPEQRQLTIRVPRGDDRDWNLELGVRDAEQEAGTEDRMLVSVGLRVPQFERPDITPFEPQSASEGQPAQAGEWWTTDDTARSRRQTPTINPPSGEAPAAEDPDPPRHEDFRGYTHPLQKIWGHPIYWRGRERRSPRESLAQWAHDGLGPWIMLDNGMPLKVAWFAGRHVGFVYNGEGSKHFLHDACEAIAREFLGLETPEPFKALAALAAEVLHEGGPSGVNTYDNMITTLGAGYARGRLANVLNVLSQRTKDVLAPAFAFHPCFNDEFVLDGDHRMFNSNRSSYQETRRLIWDVPAYTHYIRVAEHPTFGPDLAQANIREFVRYDACHDLSAHEAWANAQAREWLEHRDDLSAIPEGRRAFRALVGISGYLRHGTSGYARNPVREVRYAMSCSVKPSAQLAVLLQRYAASIGRTRNDKDVHEMALRVVGQENCMFGKRIEHFEQAMRADGFRDWSLNRELFHGVMSCIGPGSSWLSASSWTHVSVAEFERDHSGNVYLDTYPARNRAQKRRIAAYLGQFNRWDSAGSLDLSRVEDDQIEGLRERVDADEGGTINQVEFMHRLGYEARRHDMGAPAQRDRHIEEVEH